MEPNTEFVVAFHHSFTQTGDSNIANERLNRHVDGLQTYLRKDYVCGKNAQTDGVAKKLQDYIGQKESMLVGMFNLAVFASMCISDSMWGHIVKHLT